LLARVTQAVVDCDHVYVELHTIDRISEAIAVWNRARLRYDKVVLEDPWCGGKDRLSHRSDRRDDRFLSPVEEIHSNWLYRMRRVSDIFGVNRVLSGL
jgi:hypothetical protein